MNLALNARDAMPDGGVISVLTDLADEGACALLAVSDSGLGMPEEVRARAFEPHFTTKAYGSGLGLHSCLRIVTQLSGRMEIESELGTGTVVRVYLPVRSAR